MHRGELGLQAADHVAGADPALGQRLQVDLDAAAVGGGVDPVDADERGEALDGRVAEDHGRQRLLAIRHRGEGDRRWRLGDAEDDARVLHGEEALRHDHVEENGGDQCPHRDHERRGLALQHPAQRRAVAVDERFEEPFRGAVEAALLAAAPEQARAHHRRQRERDDRGDEDRDAQRDRKFAEEPAHHVAHEEQRDQHGDERHGERHDREADLRRPLERGLERRGAVLDVAGGVLDHHDRVVDDEARRDRERHEREIVEAVPEQVHDSEGADDREGNGHARDDGGRRAPQEEEQHHHDERDGEHQGKLHVVHRRADRRGAVGQDLHLDRGGQRGGELRQQPLDPVDHADDVRARLALDVHDDGGYAVHPRRLLHVLGVVLHVGDVREADGRAVPIGDDQLPVVVAREQLIVGVDRVRLRGALEVALRLVDVRLRDRGAHVFEADLVGGERRRVRLDPHRRLLPAAEAHQADPRELRDLLREAGVGEVLHLRQRQRVGGERERQDRRVGRVRLAVDRRVREVARQVRGGRVDRRLHLLLGDVDAQLERELERDHRAPEGARREHLLETRHLAELLLERRRHRRRHDVGPGARVEGEHLDRRIVDLRQRRDRQLVVGDGAGQHDRRHEQRGGDRPQDEEPRRVHAAGFECVPSCSVSRACTSVPLRSLSTPSITTTSPAASPDSIAASVRPAGPTVSVRTSTV